MSSDPDAHSELMTCSALPATLAEVCLFTARSSWRKALCPRLQLKRSTCQKMEGLHITMSLRMKPQMLIWDPGIFCVLWAKCCICRDDIKAIKPRLKAK